MNNSDARLLIVQDTDMREKADGAIEECPSLEHIVTIATGGLDELKAYGAKVSDEELDERIESVSVSSFAARSTFHPLRRRAGRPPPRKLSIFC